MASNSDILPCVAVDRVKRRHAAVVPSTNYAPISVRAAPWENWSLFQNSEEGSSRGWSPERHSYHQLHSQRRVASKYSMHLMHFCALSSDRTMFAYFCRMLSHEQP